jgi:serine protease SohB
MSRSWSDYLLFLAETVTLVVAVLVVVAGGAAVVTRLGRRARQRPRLHVTDLGRRYDDLMWTLQGHLVPRKVVRRQRRADRKRRKAQGRAAEARPTEPNSGSGSPASSAPESRPPAARPRVFVLDFVGDMRASGVGRLREEVTAVLSVAAPGDEVVVRLENPGGLVHEQGLAASQLLRIRQRGIPLTVAVDKVAASGGYMMACVADRIVAAPFALVGSIGVIAQIPNVHRLLDRYGVEVEQFKGGEFKRTVTPFNPTGEAERTKFTQEIEDVHTLFKDFVAANRPQVDLARVATGEAWYGTRALELQLVDELATSDDHLLAARARADLFHVGYHTPRPMGRRLVPATAALFDRLFPFA